MECKTSDNPLAQCWEIFKLVLEFLFMYLSSWKIAYFNDFQVNIQRFMKVFTKELYTSTATKFRSNLQTHKVLSKMQIQSVDANWGKRKKANIELELALRETDMSLWQYNYAHFNQNLIIIIKKPYSVNNNGKVLHLFNPSHNVANVPTKWAIHI